VIGCLLAERGLSMEEVAKALGRLRSGNRKANRGCPETRAEIDVIRGVARPRERGTSSVTLTLEGESRRLALTMTGGMEQKGLEPEFGL
jgi:hypothetical protein